MPEVHPALVLMVGAAAVAALPRRVGGPVGVAAAVGGLAALLRLDLGTAMTYEFYGYDLTVLRFDELARPFAVVFAVFAVVASLYGWSTMGRLERAAAMGTAGAGIGVVLAGDLLTLFFFWELKVSTSVLLVLVRRHGRSGAAGMRYLFVHLVGGVALLGGILWHLAGQGTLALEAFEMTGATWLILLGVLLSAAVPPLNAWLPDAYPASTVAGTVVLSAFTTKSAVYVLARSFAGVELLLWLGVAMAIFGVLYAVLEDDIRRLLCYHIISQVGFMVAAVGVGTEEAVNGATAHASAHVLYKGLLLMGVGTVLYATGRSRASELGGLARALPWVLGLYMVGAASIAGVPLFSGFPAKELATASMSGAGHEVAYYVLKLASVGTFLSVFLKLPATTWLGPARGSTRVRKVPLTMYVAMGTLAAANIAIGVAPGLLYGVMPTGVEFEPFSPYRVVDQVSLMVFTTIGFVLLRPQLVPKASTLLDTDVAYREVPARLAPLARRVADGARVLPDGAGRLHRRVVDRGVAWQAWVRTALGPVDPGDGTAGPGADGRRSTGEESASAGAAAPRDLGPGWLIGSALLSAVVLVLVVGVLT